MRLLRHLAPQRRLVVAAVICSLFNKLFDLAPPVLIGLAVDVVLLKQQSVLAGFGLKTASQQLWGLALLTFVIWAAESLFEYLYDVLWRNLAQTTQHSLRLEAYDHLQKLELAFFEQDSTGRLMAVLNDDINQLERFLDRGANQILQLITTVLVVGIGMAMVAPEVALFAYLPIPVILWGSLHFQRQLQLLQMVVGLEPEAVLGCLRQVAPEHVVEVLEQRLRRPDHKGEQGQTPQLLAGGLQTETRQHGLLLEQHHIHGQADQDRRGQIEQLVEQRTGHRCNHQAALRPQMAQQPHQGGAVC